MKEFFEVIEDEYKELAKLGYEIRDNLYTNPSLSIMKSRTFAEKLLVEVAKKEKAEYLIGLSQYERINLLKEDGVIDFELVKSFNDIRVIGNLAVHEDTNNDVEYSIRLYKKVYKITKWFFESYSSKLDEQFPLLRIPDYPKPEEKGVSISEIDDIFERKIQEYIILSNKKIEAEEKGIQRSDNMSDDELENEKAAMDILGFKYNDEILVEDNEEVEQTIKINISNDSDEVKNKEVIYEYKKLKRSYLLNELSKLSMHSQEAVESSEIALDNFKTYLHVKRSIEDELVEILKQAKEKEKSQLILLCGSVGDGKSHLLSHMREAYPELLEGYVVHNDATESFDPNLTDIETLEGVLEDFNDENIETSQKRLILAINLGVLNNFIQTESKKGKYKKLVDFIDNTGIFNQDTITSNNTSESFKLVSFGDYNIYELTEEGPESAYIKELFERVVKADENNPFYNAYKMDIEERTKNPAILNYQLLSIPGVIDRITKLIIKSIVKNKRLPGTRELLNLIYEILVPANIEEFDISSSASDYISVLIPNILFNSHERSELLKLISKEDPLKIREENLDKLIIELNISSDINKIVRNYIDDEKEQVLSVLFDDVVSFKELQSNVKQEYIETIIRLLYLVGKEEFSKVFEEEAYKKYMTYLYFFNCGKFKKYRDLFEEVKEAIFKWNGSPKLDYIYINNELENFNIAESLKIKRTKKVATCTEVDDKKIEKFKTNIKLAYQVVDKEKYEVLELDYQLYKKVIDTNRGCYASKNDKEEAVVFIEFLDRLLLNGNMEKEVLIEDKRTKKKFILAYDDDDDDDEFSFRRVDE